VVPRVPHEALLGGDPMSARSTALAFVAGAVVMVCTAMCLPDGSTNEGDPWLTSDDGTRHFEDGSWIAADGSQGCTEGMPCSELPPVPDDQPTTPTGGYYPTLTLVACPVEDADNCYWDAARMGNGQGTSFVTIGGVTYYPEVAR